MVLNTKSYIVRFNGMETSDTNILATFLHAYSQFRIQEYGSSERQRAALVLGSIRSAVRLPPPPPPLRPLHTDDRVDRTYLYMYLLLTTLSTLCICICDCISKFCIVLYVLLTIHSGTKSYGYFYMITKNTELN